MSIEKQVKDILIEKFAVVPDDNKTLVKDLYLDSLDIVELFMELEKTFAISIPEDMAEQISLMTVAELIKYVIESTGGNILPSATIMDSQSEQKPVIESTGGKIPPSATIMVSQSEQKPVQNSFKGLYTTSASGKAKCRLTGRPCQKIKPGEIEKNTQLLNLCRQYKCIIEKNFQEIMQEHTK
ncbi:MAG: acyl carrier protein [Alphaproteobacteria bacterium]|nr:acyl carrier protein [Alphaproteobacteria bacterium]